MRERERQKERKIKRESANFSSLSLSFFFLSLSLSLSLSLALSLSLSLSLLSLSLSPNDKTPGKDASEYAAWILDPKNWGGGIELSIFAKHYGVELAAHDIATGRVDLYGQNAGASKVAMLVYDGLHYDALALARSPFAPEAGDATLFSLSDPRTADVRAAAAELVARARANRQFTDTARFTLRCGVCQCGLKGEKEALEHAKATGHQNFQE